MHLFQSLQDTHGGRADVPQPPVSAKDFEAFQELLNGDGGLRPVSVSLLVEQLNFGDSSDIVSICYHLSLGQLALHEFLDDLC